MHRGKTILIVEDDPNDQFVLLHAFRSIGVENPIHLVAGGLEALAYFRGDGAYADRQTYGYPAFVTTDLKMPRGDGFMILDYLNVNRLRAKVLIAVLSASNDEDDVRKAYDLGATSYHVKPAGHAALEHQLRAMYDFWTTCQLPEADMAGNTANTSSERKLGERFDSPPETQKFSDRFRSGGTHPENPS